MNSQAYRVLIVSIVQRECEVKILLSICICYVLKQRDLKDYSITGALFDKNQFWFWLNYVTTTSSEIADREPWLLFFHGAKIELQTEGEVACDGVMEVELLPVRNGKICSREVVVCGFSG